MTAHQIGLARAMRGLGKLLGGIDNDAAPRAASAREEQAVPSPARLGGEDAAVELDRYRNTLDNVGSFLIEHAIEPLPDHYALAYRHRIAGEPGLGKSIAALIRDGHAMLEAIRENPEALSVELLHSLVEQAQRQLTEVAALAYQSGEDARAYGNALEENISELAPAIAANPTLSSLVGLTRVMIEKTSAAEALMRESAVQMDTMRDNLDQAREQAETDVLTGLSNRRAFDRLLGAAAERAASQGTPLSIAFCDIDHFKEVNDTYGHDVGDRVLTFVAKLLVEHVGRRGVVARHGGEEFALLFEGISQEDAFEIVDIARYDLAKRNIIDRQAGQPIGTITISAGASGLAADGNISGMLRRADRALYRAKRGGRNLVLLADADSTSASEETPLP